MPILLHELVRVQIFSGGLAPSDQEQMIDAETERIRPADKPIDRHGERNTPHVDGLAKGGAISRSPDENVSKAGAEEKETEKGSSTDEYKEVTIVTTADTIV